jgi:membrane protease YdiL (CAAX protease family)
MLLGMSVVLEGGLLLLAHLLGIVFDVAPWGRLRFTAWEILLGALATLPLFLYLFVSVRSSWEPMRTLCRSVRDMAGGMFAVATWLDLLIVASLAGLCEETFFRGFLQTLLGREWNQTVALVTTALLFALAHPVSRLYAVIAGGISLYLGFLFAASQSLAMVIVAHGLYDFLAILYWRRQARETSAGRRGPGEGEAGAGANHAGPWERHGDEER